MHPSVPRPIRLVLVLATIASLLALPSLASAVPKGEDLTADIVVMTPTVSPDGVIAMDASFVNSGTSTITHFAFYAEVTGASFVGADVAGAPYNCNDPNEDGRADTIICQLGSLASQQSAALRVFFDAPDTGGDPVIQAYFFGDAGQGSETSARVDVWTDPDALGVTINTTGDFFGTWFRSGSPTFSTLAAGGTNGQSTQASVPAGPANYLVTIAEFDGGACSGLGEGFGDAVALDIAGGLTFPAGQHISLTLNYDATAAEGKKPGQVQMTHDCAPIPANCKKSPDFCFTATKAGDGLTITVNLPHNGIVKGF